MQAEVAALEARLREAIHLEVLKKMLSDTHNLVLFSPMPPPSWPAPGHLLAVEWAQPLLGQPLGILWLLTGACMRALWQLRPAPAVRACIELEHAAGEPNNQGVLRADSILREWPNVVSCRTPMQRRRRRSKEQLRWRALLEDMCCKMAAASRARPRRVLEQSRQLKWWTCSRWGCSPAQRRRRSCRVQLRRGVP
jgi:hypothetical protein